MLRFAFLVLTVAMLVLGSISESFAEKRVALVIGNSTYKHTQFLPNPKNDAVAIAAMLKQIGFESVTVKTDLGVDGMRKALRDFGDAADGADTAVVFFAGHGLELGSENYLVPIDARLRKDRHLQFEAVKLSSALRSVEGAKRLRLVMLDACRNNPFAASMRLSAGTKRSVTRGFSRVEPEGDVLVAYASRHGTTADDGSGKHSPYTNALLTHMAEPGIDIRLMLGKVRDNVRAATSGGQVPHIYGTLGGSRIYLVPPKNGASRDKVAELQERLKHLEAQLEKKKNLESKVAVGVIPDTPVKTRHAITIPDGFTSAQVVDHLIQNGELVGKIKETPAEGSLLPDIYRFNSRTRRQELIDRMQTAMRDFVAKLWASRASSLPLASPAEALVLASIVEKETGSTNEHGRIARVFINRLNKGMRLQSDPTIIYGITKGQRPLGRPLSRSDIAKPTEFNTYHIERLPPTPIANPSRTAIKAVLNPVHTDALFFVADGTGGYRFSATLAGHQQNVKHWRSIQRGVLARDKARSSTATRGPKP